MKHKFAFAFGHWNTLHIKDAAIGLYELVRGENLRIGNTTNVKDRLHLAVNSRTQMPAPFLRERSFGNLRVVFYPGVG